jgi:hypothetical protein
MFVMHVACVRILKKTSRVVLQGKILEILRKAIKRESR